MAKAEGLKASRFSLFTELYAPARKILRKKNGIFRIDFAVAVYVGGGKVDFYSPARKVLREKNRVGGTYYAVAVHVAEIKQSKVNRGTEETVVGLSHGNIRPSFFGSVVVNVF